MAKTVAKWFGFLRYANEELSWRVFVRVAFILFFLGSGLYYTYLAVNLGASTLIYGLVSFLVCWMWTPHFNLLTLRYAGGELETGMKILISAVMLLIYFA